MGMRRAQGQLGGGSGAAPPPFFGRDLLAVASDRPDPQQKLLGSGSGAEAEVLLHC